MTYSPLLLLNRGKVHQKEFRGQVHTAEGVPANKVSVGLQGILAVLQYINTENCTAMYLWGVTLQYMYNPASQLSFCSKYPESSYQCLLVLHGQYLHFLCLLFGCSRHDMLRVSQQVLQGPQAGLQVECPRTAGPTGAMELPELRRTSQWRSPEPRRAGRRRHGRPGRAARL